MSYLKLFRDEPEAIAPEPLPFEPIERSWRSAGADHDPHDSHDPGEQPMDSIKQVEQALSQVDKNLESLSEQVDEYCAPIRMADWLDEHDDGPWAA
jgi:hypothetical protein